MNILAIVFILAGLLIFGVIIAVIIYIVIKHNNATPPDQSGNVDIYLSPTNGKDQLISAAGTYINFVKYDLAYYNSITDYFTYYDKTSGSVPGGAIQYYGVSNAAVVLTVDIKAKDPMSFSVYINGMPDGQPAVSSDPTILGSQDLTLTRNYTMDNGDWIVLRSEDANSTVLANSTYKLERPSK